MKPVTLKILLLVVGIILVGINVSQLDFNNLMNERYYGILSNLLLIAAMIVSIRYTARKRSE